MAPRHLALMLLMDAVWGFAVIAGKAGVTAFPPVFFTMLRFALLGLVLLPFLRWHPGQMKLILWIGLTAGAFQFAFFFTGVKLADDVSTVAIATQLGVPFSTILSIFFLNETVRWRRWTGIALAFGGVAVIGFDPRVAGYLDALGLVVISAFIGSVATILMRKIEGLGVFQMQVWIAVISTPLLALLSFATETGQIEALGTADWRGWGGVVFTALGSSLIGHGGLYWLLQRYEVSKIMPLTLLSPPFTVFCGVLIMGDQLTWRMIVGGLLTLAGVLIIALRRPEEASPRTA